MSSESSDEEFLSTPVTLLTKALSLNDCNSEGGTVIDIVSDVNNEDNTSRSNSCADDVELLKYSKHEFLSNEADDKSPFEKLALTMESITSDNGVLKKLLHPGIGSIIPENCLVTVHYNGYVEYSAEPFDSTYLRKSKFKFRLKEGNIIEGLRLGIASMRLREKSQFLIEPKYAYGDLGCSPRIPPSSSVLFEVELLSFTQNEAVFASKEITEDNSKIDKFEENIKHCKREHAAGNDYFRENQLEKANERYKKAVNLLEKMSLRNEEDEVIWKRLLIKLYLNLALLNERLEHNKTVCHYCHAALRLDERNTKALFRLGRAQLKNGEYKMANYYLAKAKRIEPSNQEIVNELKRLQRRKELDKLVETDMCKKMFLEPASKQKN